MAVNRLTTDISDGNNSRGVGFETTYEIAANLASGTTVTRIRASIHWDYTATILAVGATTWTWTAAYPFNVTLQVGAHGFTPLAATRGNYGNSEFLVIEDELVVSYVSYVFPGTTDNINPVEAALEVEWTGELYLSVASDIYIQSYAGHQASPQVTFQQHGTANVFYG